MTDTPNPILVVRGPDGIPICANDLPADHTTRWIKRRKHVVAAAVRGGLLSEEVALARYRLCADELHGWIEAIASNPIAGQPVQAARRY